MSFPSSSSQPIPTSTASIMTPDPNIPPEKKFFHFHSQSVPFNLPPPGQSYQFEVGFPTPTIQTHDFFTALENPPKEDLNFEMEMD